MGKEICYEKKNGEYKHSINIDIDIAMFWGFSLCVFCMFGTVLVRKPKDLLIIIPLCLLASFITAYLSNKNIFYLVPCLFAVPIIVMIIDLSRGKNS